MSGKREKGKTERASSFESHVGKERRGRLWEDFGRTERVKQLLTVESNNLIFEIRAVRS